MSIDSSCIKADGFEYKYVNSPSRWCEIHRNMWEKYGMVMYEILSVHVVGVIEETYAHNIHLLISPQFLRGFPSGLFPSGFSFQLEICIFAGE